VHRRFEAMGSMNGLDQAILMFEQVVASTLDDHPDRIIYQQFEGCTAKPIGAQGINGRLELSNHGEQEGVLQKPDRHPDRPLYLTTQFKAAPRGQDKWKIWIE
jgi:hypothetical protein